MSGGHPLPIRLRAIELVIGDKIGPKAAAKQLGREFGVCPTRGTIERWVYPDRDARRTAARSRRRAGRHAGRLGNTRVTAESKVARMRALADLGASAHLIAKLMAFDFPTDLRLDANDVRYCIRTGRYAG